MPHQMIARCVTVLSLLSAVAASATPIMVDTVRTAGFMSGLAGVAVDESTGKFYKHNGYSGGSSVLVYANAAAFDANTPMSTITLGGGGFYGTYFEVSNGKIFGRIGSSNTAVARWDATTGVRDLSKASFPGMGGANGPDTFNWGGYSGVNWMQDQTGLYVLGHNTGSTVWQLNKMDANLNVLSTLTANLGTLGYAFLVNGNLFASSSVDSNVISKSLNLATGTLSTVDFLLSAPTGQNWANVSYDHSTDTLLLNSYSRYSFYQISNASAQFGTGPMLTSASANLVSAPPTWALAVLALALMGATLGARARKVRSLASTPR